MEAVHKKPRKSVVRSTPYDLNNRIRLIRHRNFEVKRWIQNFYEDDQKSLKK